MNNIILIYTILVLCNSAGKFIERYQDWYEIDEGIFDLI